MIRKVLSIVGVRPQKASLPFLSMTFSWDEFVISFLLTRFDTTLPVEIWTRFMKSAHQGVAVAALPGLGGPSFASALPTANVPMPPAPIVTQGGGSGVRPVPIERGLDGWFIDRLFGRR